VYLPEDVHRDLKLLAKTEGVNFSTLVRQGAEEIIKKKKIRKKDWRKLVGVIKGEMYLPRSTIICTEKAIPNGQGGNRRKCPGRVGER